MNGDAGERPLNICLISREYPPFFGGGIGTYTVQWSRALAAAGHRVVVVTVSGDGREEREVEGGVTVVRLPFIKEGDWSGPHPAIATAAARAAFATFSPVSVLSMQIAGAIERLTGEFGFDVVEAPETGALGWFALNARRNGRLFRDGGPAFVTVLHSPTEWIAKWNRSPLRGRRDVELVGMERDCVEWSDGVACPTGALARWAEERWGVEGVDVMPHPLGELEGVARRVAEGELAAERGRGIVFAGRLEPRKGVDTLIDGFGMAVGRGADLTLELVGEDMPDPQGGGLFGEIRVSREPAGVRERIRRHGRMRPERVEELQAGAGVIAVPSPMDNFPYSCVEAMARGRVIVAARAGGMAEMIRDGIDGVLFEPGDAASCAGALERAAGLSGEEAARMGRSAAGRILELCGNGGVVARRVGHYRAVTAGRRTRERSADGRGFVFVNGRAEGLAEAAAAAGADFAHGWTRDGEGRVRVYSTPDASRLALAGGAEGAEIGPLVISEAAAEDPEVAPLLEGSGPERRVRSGWALAMVLLARGSVGTVVPEVASEVAGRGEGEKAALAAAVRRAEAAEGELKRIWGSRGWAWLQRVYRVLHVVRGRG